MGRKKEDTPQNIKRYTIQMDRNLYTAVRRSSLDIGVKTYELMNRIVLLGAEQWSPGVAKKEARIDVNKNAFRMARELNNRLFEKEKIA